MPNLSLKFRRYKMREKTYFWFLAIAMGALFYGSPSFANKRVESITMCDLSRAISPERFPLVNPRVVRFYQNPENYEGTTGVDMKWMTRRIATLSAKIFNQGGISDKKPGPEAYALNNRLRTDSDGNLQWWREIETKTGFQPLFHAGFTTTADGLVRETFPLRFFSKALFFRATPDHSDGVILKLDKSRHRILSKVINITYQTSPVESELHVTGRLHSWIPGVGGMFYAKLRPKQTAEAADSDVTGITAREKQHSSWMNSCFLPGYKDREDAENAPPWQLNDFLTRWMKSQPNLPKEKSARTQKSIALAEQKKELLERLTPNHLEALEEMLKLYHVDLQFADTAQHETTGRAQFAQMMRRWLGNSHSLTTRVNNYGVLEDEALIAWDSRWKPKLFGVGRFLPNVPTQGLSHLKLREGKIAKQIDYIDPIGGMISSLPLIGRLYRHSTTKIVLGMPIGSGRSAISKFMGEQMAQTLIAWEADWQPKLWKLPLGRKVRVKGAAHLVPNAEGEITITHYWDSFGSMMASNPVTKWVYASMMKSMY